MVLLQIGSFEEFSNWLFIIAFSGFTMFFWRWLSGILKDLQKRAERTGDIVRDMELRMQKHETKMERIDSDLTEVRNSQRFLEEHIIDILKQNGTKVVRPKSEEDRED